MGLCSKLPVTSAFRVISLGREMSPKRCCNSLQQLVVLGLLCLAGSSLNATDQAERESAVCESLQDCVSRIGSFTSPGGGVLAGWWEFAGQFQKFGEPALAYLPGLLGTQDEDLLDIAGAAIAQFEDIDERHLPSILAGEHIPIRR